MQAPGHRPWGSGHRCVMLFHQRRNEHPWRLTHPEPEQPMTIQIDGETLNFSADTVEALVALARAERSSVDDLVQRLIQSAVEMSRARY